MGKEVGSEHSKKNLNKIMSITDLLLSLVPLSNQKKDISRV